MQMPLIGSRVIYIFFALANIIITSSEDKFASERLSQQEFFFHGIRLTEFGEYNQLRKCPPGQYIIGLRLKKVNEKDSIVDTVSSIEITCSDRIGNKNSKFTLAVGKGGYWGEYLECPRGFAVGIKLKMTYSRPQNLEKHLEHINLHCSTGAPSDFMNSVLHGENSNFGISNGDTGLSYNYAQFCVYEEAMTELKIVANSEIEFFKDAETKVKAIDINCKSLISPARFCNFSMKWDKFRVENCSEPFKVPGNFSNSKYEFTCFFRAHVGVSYNKEIRNIQKILDAYHIDEDFISSQVRFVLMQKLLNARGSKVLSDETMAISLFLKEKTWQRDSFATIKFNQPFHPPKFMGNPKGEPKIRIEDKLVDLKHEEFVQQLVGICGIYQFRFHKFRMRHEIYFNTVINSFPTKVAIIT